MQPKLIWLGNFLVGCSIFPPWRRVFLIFLTPRIHILYSHFSFCCCFLLVICQTTFLFLTQRVTHNLNKAKRLVCKAQYILDEGNSFKAREILSQCTNTVPFLGTFLFLNFDWWPSPFRTMVLSQVLKQNQIDYPYY